MSGGPLLTASLWDPGRPEHLAARVREVAAATALPTSATPGDVAGCVHLYVRAGELGLGLPEDPPTAWTRLGVSLGELVLAVEPVLALVATEWAAEGLLDPDAELLGPGLASGWVRTGALDAARLERFERLAGRGTARPHGGGLVWAARGTVSLDATVAGEASEVAGQVFRAWTGTSPADSAVSPRLVLGLPPGIGEDEVATALPATYEVLGVAGGTAVARPPAWAGPAAAAADLADAGLLLEAPWGLVEATEHGRRGPVALWVPGSRGDLVAELAGLLPGADGPVAATGGSLLPTGGAADDAVAAAVARLRGRAGTMAS